jgi:hypothetical protein
MYEVCLRLGEEGGEGGKKESATTYIWPAIALRLCLLFALRARQQWRIVQPGGASV